MSLTYLTTPSGDVTSDSGMDDFQDLDGQEALDEALAAFTAEADPNDVEELLSTYSTLANCNASRI